MYVLKHSLMKYSKLTKLYHIHTEKMNTYIKKCFKGLWEIMQWVTVFYNTSMRNRMWILSIHIEELMWLHSQPLLLGVGGYGNR